MGALIAILPGTTLYVFLGALSGDLTESASSGSNPTVSIIVLIVGAVFGFVAIGVTSYYAKKELNKIIEAREANNKSNDVENDNMTNDTAEGKVVSRNITEEIEV